MAEAKIIERIQKMLAVANDKGATENERETALRMAYALEDIGGCDHSVGICCCEDYRAIVMAEKVLADTSETAKRHDARVKAEAFREISKVMEQDRDMKHAQVQKNEFGTVQRDRDYEAYMVYRDTALWLHDKADELEAELRTAGKDGE